MEQLGQVIFTEKQIKQRVMELAEMIVDSYPQENLHIVGILDGAFMFMADLIKNIPFPCYTHFIKSSGYKGSRLKEQVEVFNSLNLKGKQVILVEDIIDTGSTIREVIKSFNNMGVQSIKTCVLLHKKKERLFDFEPDWIGFESPDCWVVGYGFDLDGYYRNLPYIAEVLFDKID